MKPGTQDKFAALIQECTKTTTGQMYPWAPSLLGPLPFLGLDSVSQGGRVPRGNQVIGVTGGPFLRVEKTSEVHTFETGGGVG